MAFEKISIPSAKECFFEDIKSKILTGELTAGQKLPSERELSERTGINQSAIHLAIKDLEHAGFLNIIPRHGTYVADYVASGNYDTLHEILKSGGQHMTPERIIALVETRNAIEGGALIRLAASHTPEDIKELEAHIERFRSARQRTECGRTRKDDEGFSLSHLQAQPKRSVYSPDEFVCGNISGAVAALCRSLGA